MISSSLQLVQYCHLHSAMFSEMFDVDKPRKPKLRTVSPQIATWRVLFERVTWLSFAWTFRKPFPVSAPFRPATGLWQYRVLHFSLGANALQWRSVTQRRRQSLNSHVTNFGHGSIIRKASVRNVLLLKIVLHQGRVHSLSAALSFQVIHVTLRWILR